MPEINKAIITNIITKAREINIEEDMVFPEDQDDLSDAEWKQLLAEYQNDLSYIELQDLINDLEPDQQKQVIALMYVGRGDFDKSEWNAALMQAQHIHPKTRADYLISKSMLSDYLTEGLAEFGLSVDE